MDAGSNPNRIAITNTKENPGFFFSIISSPLVVGGFLTFIFYKIIPWLPVQQELVQRYFCSHPLEYATATLFFIGMTLLVMKRMGTTAEKTAITTDLIGNSSITENVDSFEKVSLIEKKIELLPMRLRETHIFRRISDVCVFIRGRKSTQDLDEHLKYLAELSLQRMHESYAPVRTITWAVPIIGFLGTVIGITIAVANVTPEQLDTSLSDVTGGLAVAFDTTALALTLSVVLVFSSFFVERDEQQILADVEDFGIRRIIPLFPPQQESNGPLADAEIQAAETLLRKTEILIDRQTAMWHQSLDSMRERWTDTLQNQSAHLNAALQQGTAATLESHAQQLAEVREQFLHSAQHVQELMTIGLKDAREAQHSLQETFQEQVNQLWQMVRNDLAGLQDHQKIQIEQLIASLSENVGAWQSTLNQTTETGVLQLDELRQQREVLLQVVGEEKELARLQTKLTNNLEAIRASETFEKTLLSLSAAVNMLTARSRPNAA